MKHPVTKLKYCARSDIGLVRSCNEDAYAVGGGESDEYPGSLFVVCDGMGGRDAGAVAAQLAANTIIEAYLSSENPDRGAVLVAAYRRANERAHQQVKSGFRGWTTATAALFVEGKFYVAHVGDSRAYRFKKNHLQQITEDHLYSELLIRQGVITREDVRTHCIRDNLLRAIGNEENIEVDLFVDKLQKDDVILLCTDGVWIFVEDTDIERIIRENPPKDVVGHLINQANARGGPDNATAILVWRGEQKTD